MCTHNISRQASRVGHSNTPRKGLRRFRRSVRVSRHIRNRLASISGRKSQTPQRPIFCVQSERQRIPQGGEGLSAKQADGIFDGGFGDGETVPIIDRHVVHAVASMIASRNFAKLIERLRTGSMYLEIARAASIFLNPSLK